MDHGFNDRVDKVFGSISSSSSSSSWSLTDAQVERRPWNRDKEDSRDDDQTPVSSSFHNLFNSQTENLDDDGLHAENDWDIRSSIGLDSTLDNEEEEDAYDKMAEGRENAGERLYMKDVTDHGPYLNSHNVLPNSVHDVKKDPRANHDAAINRLKEDDGGSDEPMLNANHDAGKTRLKEGDAVQGSDEPMLSAETSEDGTRIKSILKRKNDDVVKPAKRVRFDSTCKNDYGSQLQGSGEPKLSENGRSVPDYILNPSKYTRYTFDDCTHDVSERSYTDAYMDLLEQIKKSKHVKFDSESEQKLSEELPKSLVFIPRKKRGDADGNNEVKIKQSSTEADSKIGIAAVEVQEGEISEMQEDESHVDYVCSKTRFQKQGRRYRSKMDEDDDVS